MAEYRNKNRILYPLGATQEADGVRILVQGRAKEVCLLLYRPGEKTPCEEIPFDPKYQMGDVWELALDRTDFASFEYNFMIDGKIVTDPHARIITGREKWADRKRAGKPVHGRVLSEEFDWEDDVNPETPYADTILYKLHVRGFTAHASSGVSARGTYAGVVEKIPYLKDLGITAVELMPVTEFDEEYISLSDKIRIGRELFNSFRKLDVLQELLEDDSITEIMVNGIDHIFYEKEGRIFRSKKCFLSQERLLDVIQQIVGESNRYVNEASPIVDARLKDGSRVNVVLNPVAVNGPILTIRKFPSEAITMEQLIRIGSVTDEAANFLKKLVAAKYNIFVSGGTGAGKTTFLNALSNYIPKGERLITIEDNAELQIQGVQNLVRLEARGPNAEGEGAVTIRDLIKSALRMRPDRIVVGEVRGEETVDMISSAMLNGHSGSMSTGHANNPTDMLHRLETMMLMGIDLPLQAIQRQVASALDIIIHLGRLRDKTRKVLQIVEVEGYEDGRIQTKVLYEFKEEGMKNGKIQGCLMKKNEITNKEKLLAAGYHTI